MICCKCGGEIGDAQFCPFCGEPASVSHSQLSQNQDVKETSESKTALSIISFVLGIVGLVGISWFGGGLPASIVAFILGGKSINLDKGAKGRKMGKIGIIINGIVLFVFIVVNIILEYLYHNTVIDYIFNLLDKMFPMV